MVAAPAPAKPNDLPRVENAPPTTRLADRETWDVLRIEGARAGHARTTIRTITQSGREVIKLDQTMHLAVRRFNDTTEQDVHSTCTETPKGRLIDFRTEIRQGRVPLVTTGRVEGDRLHLEISTQGKTIASSLAWSSELGGLYAAEASLLRRPMKPGEKRTLRHLAVDNQVSTTEMTAIDYEPVQLLAGSFELLRIETVQTLANGQKLKGTAWTDRSGDVLKTRMALMNIEMLRATKDLAMAKSDLPMIDLGQGIAVKLDRPLAKAHETKRVRYRVRLDEGDPAAVFPSTASQQVKKADSHTAEITVRALRPGDPPVNPDAPDAPPTDADRQPNNFIQSDDPQIVADARAAAGKETDPWRVAAALERHAYEAVTQKGFKQAFATAAEVARTREGDCKAHAVYLAALARARGIPARMAVGLVYMPRSQAFGYHAWTEVYIDKRWIALDGTLAKGGIGGGHLKLAHSNMQGTTAYSSFLPVLEVIGKLKIEVLEAE
jgi:hypothetical protein